MNQLRRLEKRGIAKRTIAGVLALILVALLVAAGCGEDATPTPAPAAATPVPSTATSVPPTATPLPPGVTPPPATATPVPSTPTPLPPGVTPPPATATPVPATATPVPAATATPVPPTTGIRPISEWTVENPATLAEIEAELEKRRGESFVFTSWGGAFQAAERQAFLTPFQDKFGIEIIEESPVSYPKVRAMAETGNITWNVVNMGMREIWPAGAVGALEELDFSIIDDRDYFETTRSPWSGGGGTTWSTVLTYSLDTYPEGGTQPKTWADFFDVEKFPARRGIRDNWVHQLTYGLLGEDPGLVASTESRAALSTLTPEQVDRSFEIWTAFKPNIDVWWTTGSDCPQLLISGELDMCTAWNGRIFDAQSRGAPLKICWECGFAVSANPYAMPNGLAEQDPETFVLAQLFVAWTGFPENNAQISKYISYGPINAKSLPYLDDPSFDLVRPHLPTSPSNVGFAIFANERHQGENADKWQERWLTMMQS